MNQFQRDCLEEDYIDAKRYRALRRNLSRAAFEELIAIDLNIAFSASPEDGNWLDVLCDQKLANETVGGGNV